MLLKPISCEHIAFDSLAPKFQLYLASVKKSLWDLLPNTSLDDPLVFARIIAGGVSYFVTDFCCDGQVTEVLVDEQGFGCRDLNAANDAQVSDLHLDVSIDPAPASAFIERFRSGVFNAVAAGFADLSKDDLEAEPKSSAVFRDPLTVDMFA